MEMLWVGLGGFVGANARFYLSREIGNRLGMTFPYGTMLVNISGSLLIGAVFTLLTDRFEIDPLWRQLLIVGFLGGYTTFSSYTLEAIDLMQEGRWTHALLYVLGNNVLSLAACFLGVVTARSIGG